MTNMVQFVKNNVDMVKSILKNLWALLVENVNLALSTFFSIVNLAFGGGNAILNFFIDVVRALLKCTYTCHLVICHMSSCSL